MWLIKINKFFRNMYWNISWISFMETTTRSHPILFNQSMTSRYILQFFCLLFCVCLHFFCLHFRSRRGCYGRSCLVLGQSGTTAWLFNAKSCLWAANFWHQRPVCYTNFDANRLSQTILKNHSAQIYVLDTVGPWILQGIATMQIFV